MDKDVTDFLNWLSGKELDKKDAFNFFEINGLFENPADKEILEQIFTKEQCIVLSAFFKATVYSLDPWHNEEDTSSHEDIRNELKKIDAHLRNHRHETTKNFSGKAEF